MRTLRLSAVLCFLLVFAACVSRRAQAQVTIPGCETPAELRTALQTELHSHRYQGIPYDAQTAIQVEVITRLIEKYPREVAPQKELVELSLWDRGYVTLHG